jgi:hypothetical protein
MASKKAHSARGGHGSATALHKRWLRAQLKLARRALKKKTASDAEHRSALKRFKDLESELQRS